MGLELRDVLRGREIRYAHARGGRARENGEERKGQHTAHEPRTEEPARAVYFLPAFVSTTYTCRSYLCPVRARNWPTFPLIALRAPFSRNHAVPPDSRPRRPKRRSRSWSNAAGDSPTVPE